MENCGVYNFQNKVLTPRVQISGFLREDGKILPPKSKDCLKNAPPV